MAKADKPNVSYDTSASQPVIYHVVYFLTVGGSYLFTSQIPSKIQLKIAYSDIPVHGGGRQIIDIFSRHRNEFDNVVVIGCDDEGVEHTFDFSSVLKHITISPPKDENEHFDPAEVRSLLLRELR